MIGLNINNVLLVSWYLVPTIWPDTYIDTRYMDTFPPEIRYLIAIENP